MTKLELYQNRGNIAKAALADFWDSVESQLKQMGVKVIPGCINDELEKVMVLLAEQAIGDHIQKNVDSK